MFPGRCSQVMARSRPNNTALVLEVNEGVVLGLSLAGTATARRAEARELIDPATATLQVRTLSRSRWSGK